MQRKTVLFTFGLALMTAPAAHAQQPGVRAPSGKGTTTAAQAAAKSAASGTPTTTAMTGAPAPPAIAVKSNVAGSSTGKTATTPVSPGAMPLVNGKPPQ
ncbi:hypothetical protein [Granulicella rosea]|nr:hypothetical protein [Granulicella rosea]